MSVQPSRLALTDRETRIVAASGVLDSHTADQLAAKLDALGTTADATLELHEIEFIDSSGLRVIVAAHQDFEAAGHALTLAGASDSVRRLLEITGLQDHLHLG